ncbi:MAG: saccharopine dehydrogenase [Pseudomonadota bacterium]
MAQTIWLRAESKEDERRTPIVPDDARLLCDAGFEVVVERSEQRIIPVEAYEVAGCRIVDAGSWPFAPADCFILGIKELPVDDEPLRHRHIYFGHVYKDQQGWRQILGRFAEGRGQLLDLECLVDNEGRRIAAFGYWAGYAGAAVSIAAWCGQQTEKRPPLGRLSAYESKDLLISELRGSLEQVEEKPTMIVIGAKGRSGSGAVDLGESLDIPVTQWDLAETSSGGPFPEILQHDLFINCVLAAPGCPKFVEKHDIPGPNRKLSVIGDVSCDPLSPYNPIPIYHQVTTFNYPLVRVWEKPMLDIVAIDHLPSLLPLESSIDYSRQLLPALLSLDAPTEGVWGRALEQFQKNIKRL